MALYAQHFARKGANEVATLIQFYIRDQKVENSRNVKIFMDNAVGTNKNRFVFVMLQHLCLTEFETVEVVLPIVRHSFLPIDRSFSIIEKRKKVQDRVEKPEDWTNLVKLARPSQLFQILHVEHPLTSDLHPEENSEIISISISSTFELALIFTTGKASNFPPKFNTSGRSS